MAAKWISARTVRAGPVAVGESYLSQLRSGVALMPSFWTVEALAAAFDVDIAYFTAEFHHRYAHATVAERVWRARADRTNHHYLLAQAMTDLPQQQQDDITTLIDLLHQQQHTVLPPALPEPSAPPPQPQQRASNPEIDMWLHAHNADLPDAQRDQFDHAWHEVTTRYTTHTERDAALTATLHYLTGKTTPVDAQAALKRARAELKAATAAAQQIDTLTGGAPA
ncbi:hypothetical protein GOEFS_059_00150 [Gordonia effusa NBRC 100432]|uniref:HTH cro/C1-type domain-containing protein n=1 Tax=Gordonia effusa NBRC 100432 TaxID=1077974 RepID=H0R0I0_9ACTN|nr:hypothetical protein GOEFS_059_00150 [Gordonia effusa NBRC 100432]